MAARRFTSVHHPGSLPWAAVYGRALATPLAACLLPVMILTLVAVLEGLTIVPYALWGAAGAIGLAALWTTFQLHSIPAEIHIDDAWVRIRSISEAMRETGDPPMRVLDVRAYDGWAHVTVGLSAFEIRRAEWPEYDHVISALRHAQEVGYGA